RGGRAFPAADLGRRYRRALRRGRGRLIRHPAVPVVAVQPDTDVACATRTLLDRDLVAGGRALYPASSQRRRAKRTEAGRECALRCSARCRGRLTGWRVLEHPWPAFRRRVLLLGPSGLGVP